MNLPGKLLFFITSDVAPHQSGLVAVKLSVLCALSVQCWSQWWVLPTEHHGELSAVFLCERHIKIEISVIDKTVYWREDPEFCHSPYRAMREVFPGTGWHELATGVTQCGHIPGAQSTSTAPALSELWAGIVVLHHLEAQHRTSPFIFLPWCLAKTNNSWK